MLALASLLACAPDLEGKGWETRYPLPLGRVNDYCGEPPCDACDQAFVIDGGRLDLYWQDGTQGRQCPRGFEVYYRTVDQLGPSSRGHLYNVYGRGDSQIWEVRRTDVHGLFELWVWWSDLSWQREMDHDADYVAEIWRVDWPLDHAEASQ